MLFYYRSNVLNVYIFLRFISTVVVVTISLPITILATIITFSESIAAEKHISIVMLTSLVISIILLISASAGAGGSRCLDSQHSFSHNVVKIQMNVEFSVLNQQLTVFQQQTYFSNYRRPTGNGQGQPHFTYRQPAQCISSSLNQSGQIFSSSTVPSHQHFDGNDLPPKYEDLFNIPISSNI